MAVRQIVADCITHTHTKKKNHYSTPRRFSTGKWHLIDEEQSADLSPRTFHPGCCRRWRGGTWSPGPSKTCFGTPPCAENKEAIQTKRAGSVSHKWWLAFRLGNAEQSSRGWWPLLFIPHPPAPTNVHIPAAGPSPRARHLSFFPSGKWSGSIFIQANGKWQQDDLLTEKPQIPAIL